MGRVVKRKKGEKGRGSTWNEEARKCLWKKGAAPVVVYNDGGLVKSSLVS